MKRFTAYRPLISQRGTHNQFQRNADHEPQYEGVIFTDGSVAIRWLTSCHSTSLFADLTDMIRIHGHPEYGTIFKWHDCEEPKEWTDYKLMCMPT